MTPKPTPGETVRTDWWEVAGLTAAYILGRTARETDAKLFRVSQEKRSGMICSGPAGSYRRGTKP